MCCPSSIANLMPLQGIMSQELLREELASREHTILKLRVRLAEMAKQLDGASKVFCSSPKQLRALSSRIQHPERGKRRLPPVN